jgi:hypothetical protein
MARKSITRREYSKLIEALDAAKDAKNHLATTRGHNKKQAQEAFIYAVHKDLSGAVERTTSMALGDLESHDIIKLAQHLIALLEKRGHIQKVATRECGDCAGTGFALDSPYENECGSCRGAGKIVEK